MKIFTFTKNALNVLIFVIFSSLISALLWNSFGLNYIIGQPTGSDYYNALTYQTFFAKYLTFPPLGWLPHFNEGSPIIGGYPFLSFIISAYLTQWFSPTVALNIFSFSQLWLFFIASLLLFWQVSKNWIVATSFTLILVATKASYFQLAIGAYIASANIQWYLPAVLFLLFRFDQKGKRFYLTLAAILSGLSLLTQGPTSLLMVFFPSSICLIFLNRRKLTIKRRLINLLAFTATSLLIGSIGVYTTFLQAFLGSGRGACQDIQCWGDYPTHLIRWLTPISLLVAATFFILAILLKIIKRNLNLLFAAPATIGFLFFVSYALAAYFKLIDGLANVIFPTRIFWAGNLFLLLIAASLYHSIRVALPNYYSYLIALLTASLLALGILLNPLVPAQNLPNVVPQNIEEYILKDFQEKPTTEIIPEWLENANNNWRVDIFNAGIVHWFNIASEIPQVKGYSNHPLGVHQDWQYFFQTSTRNVPVDTNQELAKNRALFLLDAFGVKYIENSVVPVPDFLLQDQTTVIKKDTKRDLNWLELSDSFTPIVSPTNSKTILFIGDAKAYESFIRAIAMTNLNSNILIPVKGPESLKSVDKKDLESFQAIVLYQFHNSGLEKLSDLIQDGGGVFIDSPVQNLQSNKELESIFPIKSLSNDKVNYASDFGKENSNLTQNIEVSKFAQLTFEGNPWNLSYAQEIKPWAKSALLQNGKTVVVEGKLGEGKVIWSGLNLPFHIVANDNYEEAKFFKNIMLELIGKTDYKKPSFTVSRTKPRQIKISGGDFKGIYFKENFDPGWEAKIDNQKLKVYKAGLEFMYIPLDTVSHQEVDITYRGSFVAWFIFYLTFSSLVLSCVYLLLPKLTEKIIYKSYHLSKSIFTKKVAKILEDE